VKHEFVVEHVPCLSEPPPTPPNIQGDVCPKGIAYCLSKGKAWELAQYLESTISWMSEGWALCKEHEDDEGNKDE
jgi:hypothetical protein